MEAHPQQFEEQPHWTVQDSSALYMIDRWGAGYFDVSINGDMTVAPLQERGISLPIIDALREAKALNLDTPLLIRFQDLLRHRVENLNSAFANAIADHNYQGRYRGVFPIKVNQLREVVEEILDAGRPFNYGVEVGSKPEMFAGLAIHNDPESLIVCNGYKDTTYIRMAMLGRKLGKKVIVIAEKLSEIRAITRIAAEMNVEPWIGIRVRLLSKGAGKWATSGGEHAKFGLSTAEILEAIEILREAKMESAFKLLHFHIGSQIPDILTIKRAVREAAMYYATLNESWHDLQQIKEQTQTMFEFGLLNLDVKARVETLYWQVVEKLSQIIRTMDPAEVPDDLKTLYIELADQHICNFSVFQSLLDHWALGQLFPIVPIHRLNERPMLESTLVDITCDSDGKVYKYIDLQDVLETLPQLALLAY